MFLKIKDSIDLKELEKFKFHRTVIDGRETYYKESIYCGEIVQITVKEDRTFDIYWGWYKMCGTEQERFLQDLIEADLLEKKEDVKKHNMGKNYDLYPSCQRKIGNQRRILGYEKMKRDNRIIR